MKTETEQNPWWSFVSSTRFWALLIGATSVYLKAKQVIGDPEMVLIGTVVTGFIGLKTVDRTVDKISEKKG